MSTENLPQGPNTGNFPNKKESNMRRFYSWYKARQFRRFHEFQETEITPWDTPLNSAPGTFYAERRRPARPANIESDVLVPALQAGLVAGGVAVLALYAALAYGLLSWHAACAVGVLAGGMWFAGALFWGRQLLWIVESVSNLDIDHDGAVGKPPAPAPTTLVVSLEKGRQQFLAELGGIEAARLHEFARQVAAGRSLAVNSWTGSGGLFTRSEYDLLMGELERAGLVIKGPGSSGRVLTDSGREAMRQLGGE